MIQYLGEKAEREGWWPYAWLGWLVAKDLEGDLGECTLFVCIFSALLVLQS